MMTSERLSVEDASQVPLARQLAVSHARALGLPVAEVDRVALAATELAQNLHLHAVGGELVIAPGPWQGGAAGELVLLALDRGPGVARFERCLEDGYSTTGTMGTGLGAVSRLASDFAVVSEVGRGTVVRARFGTATGAGEAFDVGAFGFPISGETVNGDAWSSTRDGDDLRVVLADGLGHGPLAADASQAAARALTGSTVSPGGFLAGAGPKLAGTRGAAATVLVITLPALRGGGTLRSSGLGNVSLLVAGPDGTSKRVATSHGTLGSGLVTKPVETASPVPANGVVILHSDGLSSRWDLTGRAELMRAPAGLIAASLWRDFARGTDDSLVVVVKAARP